MIRSIAMLCGLASCGAISDARSALKFKDIAEANYAVRENFIDRPGTIPDRIPTVGIARFDGAARIFIDPVTDGTSDNILIYGDIGMTADFRAGTMTGQIDDMRGATNIRERGADTFDVDGVITVGTNGGTIGEGRANDWSATYDGQLETGIGDFAVDGVLTGQFVGTVPDQEVQISGIYADDTDGRAQHDGAVYPVFVEIGAPLVR